MTSDYRSPADAPALGGRHVTRRGFVGATAGVVGLALGAPTPVLASNPHLDATPKPIPGGVSPFGILIHHFPLPATGTPLANISEPSQITDFNGFVGANRIVGSGSSNEFPSLSFQADMGFMVGTYVGSDGKQYHDAFGFL